MIFPTFHSNGILINIPLYLDPGPGSFILQLVLAAILGGLFLIKGSWHKIAKLFRRDAIDVENPDKHDESNPPSSDNDSA